jgi:hypothetical protein
MARAAEAVWMAKKLGKKQIEHLRQRCCATRTRAPLARAI